MTQRPRLSLRLEVLEAREVPAVVIVNPTTATYTDVDGDKVTVKVSTGTLTQANFTTVAGGVGDQLQVINLSGGGFANANLTVSVKKVAGGDGLANIGRINSTGHDLGKITIKGDLGRIDAGDAITATPALKSLTVRSMGRLGLDSQGGGTLTSTIQGTLGSLVVAGDFKDAYISVTGGLNVTIGSIAIGGSLIGGNNIFAGSILSQGDMGKVKIGGDVIGGTGFISGVISPAGRLAGVSIGGSLLGGPGPTSGMILSNGDIGGVKIGRDLKGGNVTGSTSLNNSGVIASNVGRIASVTIGGSIISGFDNSTGTLTSNATIRAGNDIGSITVKGSLIGNVTASGSSPVIISARGQAVQGAMTDLAIGKIRIGGRVEHAQILAGYDVDLAPKNADAQIGSISVGRDWIASTIAAGVVDGGNGFGNSLDAKISGAGTTDSAGIVSKIGSITIKGQALGTPNSTNAADHFGFVAQQIGTVKIGGQSFALTAGPANDLAGLSIGATGDLRIREVAL